MTDWLFPLWLSLRIALVATVVVFCLAGLAAWAVVKFAWPGRGVADALFTLPLVLPPTVTGFLLLWLLGKNGPVGRLLSAWGVQVLFTWWAGVIAAAVVAFPFMYNGAKAGLQGVDETLEKAARTLGASEWRVFFTISLPLAWPGFLAGLVLSFTRALGEFGATLMVAGNIPGRTQTMATAIYTAAEAGETRTAGILAGVMLAVGGAAAWAGRRWSEGLLRGRARAKRG